MEKRRKCVMIALFEITRGEVNDVHTTDDNIHRITVGDKEIILVGTAHVSQKSADQVREVIAMEQPDAVCVELCPSRYQALTDADRWKNTDLIQVIKDGKALLLLVNLVLSSYQKRLARQLGVQPGQEMIQGIKCAEETGARLCLADREIHTTMLRLWRGVHFWGKIKLIFNIMLSVFDQENVTEEELEKMKQQDMLTAALQELSHFSPRLKSILIDERDQYLAEKIKTAPGKKVVAVLGAGHVPGIKKELFNEHDLAALSVVPPAPKTTKVMAWVIPLLIVVLVAATFSVNRGAAADQVVAWVLWNGTLAGLGALLALAHPLTILTAFVVSPISSLSPLLAAGWFAGITEAFVRKPSVRDFEAITEDVYTLKGFWRNKVTHILIVVALANLGSSAGAIVGGVEVIRHFINAVF